MAIKDPVHPILEAAWKYDIVRFDLRHEPAEPRDAFLDLWLRLDNCVRCLRFARPKSIHMKCGFPWPTKGLVILDVRHRQWEDVAVEVTDFENSDGGVTFLAANVLEVTPTD